MWHGLEGMGWGWLGVGFVHLVVVWLLVVVCIAILLAVMRKSGGRRAIEILQSRYANGEIDRDEFQRMKRELTSEDKRETGTSGRSGK